MLLILASSSVERVHVYELLTQWPAFGTISSKLADLTSHFSRRTSLRRRLPQQLRGGCQVRYLLHCYDQAAQLDRLFYPANVPYHGRRCGRKTHQQRVFKELLQLGLTVFHQIVK